MDPHKNGWTGLPEPLPTTHAELSALRELCVTTIRSIDLQLTSRDKTDATGRRLSDHEYHDWRRRAVAAKTGITADLRVLNTLREAARQREREEAKSKPKGPVTWQLLTTSAQRAETTPRDLPAGWEPFAMADGTLWLRRKKPQAGKED